MAGAVRRLDYKWIALSNTTLGAFMAALDGSIVLISLPAIFRGIGINPMAPGESAYLLWLLLGFGVVTAIFLVTFGRISDMYGRVKLYNAGFAIFTVGSIMLSLVHGHGNGAAMELILFRLVQAAGAGFLTSNSAAILTDAFPANERGMALGINQIAFVGGQLIGLVAGGLLSAIDWHLIFLVSVPVGITGTVWAYLRLKELGAIQKGQRIDVAGNATFAAGLFLLLMGITFALQPYGKSPMGWTSPSVEAMLAGGTLLLGVFVWIELHVPEPMFKLSLFQRRPFWTGVSSAFLASLARGGLQFMLVIWLQGIWLPLHGYSFEQTPLWAGIFMMPMPIGFTLMGPVSGYLSDRFGARTFSTAGMVITAIAFLGLLQLPANFSYPSFAVTLLVMGMGMGMFIAPNTASIMNSVPREHRGAASGMRATLQNAATILSQGIFFTIVIVGLAGHLPGAMYSGLVSAGLPAATASQAASLPPTSALFAAFLGYNPIGTVLQPTVLAALPAATRAGLLGGGFFPALISPPFMAGLRAAFAISTGMAILAAILSVLRGERFVYEAEGKPEPQGVAQPATGA
ncbi:MAG TPA: MFS transporter [Bacillota bacterium]|nr:MFS transporter [Bacillota bacterium]